MRDLAILFLHLITTVTRLFGPGGARSIVAESLLIKHQLVCQSIPRTCAQSPHVGSHDRWAVCHADVPRPYSPISSHSEALADPWLPSRLVKRKYQLLFTPKIRVKPGPKGSSCELIEAIVAMKQRNPNWGCPKIAQQISLAFGAVLDEFIRSCSCKHLNPKRQGSVCTSVIFPRDFFVKFKWLRRTSPNRRQ